MIVDSSREYHVIIGRNYGHVCIDNLGTHYPNVSITSYTYCDIKSSGTNIGVNGRGVARLRQHEAKSPLFEANFSAKSELCVEIFDFYW